MDQQPSSSSFSSSSTKKWFDIIVTAGGRPFPANKSILSQNSDYFKSILREDVNKDYISLPNIPQDIFSILLSGMYSGSLLLNTGNAYQVLFYAQLLQMTPAILQCKNFLVNQQFLPWAAAASLYQKQWLLPNQLFGGATLLPTPPQPPPPPPIAPIIISPPPRAVDTREIKEESVKTEPDPTLPCPSSPTPPKASTSSSSCSTARESSPPLDLAACDGPVSFQRIPNPHSIKNKEGTGATALASGDSSSSDDEAHAQKEGKGGSDNSVYQCLFCNHTFKSQYCYQKHKQRHLNPFCLDFQAGDSPKKKSLILKDINVQFFPCKICGAKFPSYYFVHKHKKLWHTQEEEEEVENRFRRTKASSK